ncbi:9147_t:CDS:2 [Gigaspora margarita]|uniref:9147_t:CDS:1 n=1 Tax=Gigaspora margarita TaxID=4874 RepID=A0ABM8VZ10_GIGMA|nr:9147_t:CDS:2 [Gigaspora margarita]
MVALRNNLQCFYNLHNGDFNFYTSYYIKKDQTICVRRSQRLINRPNYREAHQYIKKHLDIDSINSDSTYITDDGFVVKEELPDSRYYCKSCDNYFNSGKCLCKNWVSNHVSKFITKQNGIVVENNVRFSDDEMQLIMDDSSDDEEFPDPEEAFKLAMEKNSFQEAKKNYRMLGDYNSMYFTMLNTIEEMTKHGISFDSPKAKTQIENLIEINTNLMRESKKMIDKYEQEIREFSLCLLVSGDKKVWLISDRIISPKQNLGAESSKFNIIFCDEKEVVNIIKKFFDNQEEKNNKIITDIKADEFNFEGIFAKNVTIGKMILSQPETTAARQVVTTTSQRPLNNKEKYKLSFEEAVFNFNTKEILAKKINLEM